MEAKQQQPKRYTCEEFYELVKDLKGRYELIDGQIVSLADPKEADGRIELVDGVPYALAGARGSHQDMVGGVYAEVRSYIQKNKGKCIVRIAPYDVRLDDGVTVQPDVMVICDKDKISDDLRCYGAPDWVIEVASSNAKYDLYTKQQLYRRYGVREYWVIDPNQELVFVFLFEKGNNIRLYDWNDTIPVGIYEDAPVPLSLRIADLVTA